MTDFASVKLSRPFVSWLKREAAVRGLPMYELVEEMVGRGGSRPWRSETTPDRRDHPALRIRRKRSIVQGVLLATVRLYGAPQMKRSRKYHTQAAKVSIP